jgi:hypothetical protein
LFDEISEESDGIEYGTIYKTIDEHDNVISLSTNRMYDIIKTIPPDQKLVKLD